MLSEAALSSQLAMLLGLDVRRSQTVLRMLPSLIPYRLSRVVGRMLSARLERLLPKRPESLPKVWSIVTSYASVLLRTSSRTP